MTKDSPPHNSDRRSLSANDALLKALIDSEQDSRKEKDLEHSRRLLVQETTTSILQIKIRRVEGAGWVLFAILTWFGVDKVITLWS